MRATDIRAGAGLVIAGLCADGVTEVSHVHHVDRGYPDFVADLRALGVAVERGHRARRIAGLSIARGLRPARRSGP